MLGVERRIVIGQLLGNTYVNVVNATVQSCWTESNTGRHSFGSSS